MDQHHYLASVEWLCCETAIPPWPWNHQGGGAFNDNLLLIMVSGYLLWTMGNPTGPSYCVGVILGLNKLFYAFFWHGATPVTIFHTPDYLWGHQVHRLLVLVVILTKLPTLPPALYFHSSLKQSSCSMTFGPKKSIHFPFLCALFNVLQIIEYLPLLIIFNPSWHICSNRIVGTPCRSLGFCYSNTIPYSILNIKLYDTYDLYSYIYPCFIFYNPRTWNRILLFSVSWQIF